jgi:hypothetical protein
MFYDIEKITNTIKTIKNNKNNNKTIKNNKTY